MPETPSEKEDTSETVDEVYKRVQDLSEEELRELYSRLSSGTEDGDADYRILPVPYPVQRAPTSARAMQSTRPAERDWDDLFPPDWPPDWIDDIRFPPPPPPWWPPDPDPDPGWPTPPKPIPIPDEDEIGEEEEQLNLLSGGSLRTAASRTQPLGQPTISIKMTADLREENSGGEIPIHDVNMKINISEDSEGRGTVPLGDIQRVAMEAIKELTQSSGNESREEQERFETDEITFEVNIY